MNLSPALPESPPVPPPAGAAPPAPPPADDLPVTVIERRPGWHLFDLAELWRYRELLYFLTWRDVKLRYKQTVLGAGWAVIQPLATMFVFSTFFGNMKDVAEHLGSLPYPLFVYAGMLPWAFFSSALTSAGQSVVSNQNLVTKVYFPRLLIPVGATGAHLVDFAVAFVLLLALMLSYGVLPGPGMLLVVPLLLLLVVAALGVGTFLAALTVEYRDFRFVVPFLVQLWLFATPCIYLPTNPDAPAWQAWVLPLNPAYGLILNFRQAVLGGGLDGYSLAVSAAVGVASFVAGCLYFRRVERGFADVI
jgi:lipopolysaccharide transport system permease protein